MGIKSLKAGECLPEDFYVVIEIQSHSAPIKYEMKKDCELLMVDRFLSTSMAYPCEYGFIPHTLAEDGDPIDVLVVSPYTLMPGVVIRCRPVGMLKMTDESGVDTKILAVPVNKLTKQYAQIEKPSDLGREFIANIEHFFNHYKDLDEGKWTKVEGWQDKATACQEIMAGVERFAEQAKTQV